MIGPWQFGVIALLFGASILSACAPRPDGGLRALPGVQTLPEIDGSYLTLGRQLLRQGDTKLAKEAFVRSMRVEGMSTAALTGAGLAAERQGLLNEAVRYFKRAQFREPASVLAHNNLGAAYYKMGRYNEAKQAFQAAYALSSGTNRVAAHNLSLSELAIRRERELAVPIAQNPRPVLRQGTGEYTLMPDQTGAQDG